MLVIPSPEHPKTGLIAGFFYQNFCLATCSGISTKAGLPPVRGGLMVKTNDTVSR